MEKPASWLSVIKSFGVLLDKASSPALTRTSLEFPTQNKKKNLQLAMDKLLGKGAIEPVQKKPHTGLLQLPLSCSEDILWSTCPSSTGNWSSLTSIWKLLSLSGLQSGPERGECWSLFETSICLYRPASQFGSFYALSSVIKLISSFAFPSGWWPHPKNSPNFCHTSVSFPFSSANSSIGLAGGKHYQKITIPIFRLVQILLFQVAFLLFCSITICSPYFLLVGSLLKHVALF